MGWLWFIGYLVVGFIVGGRMARRFLASLNGPVNNDDRYFATYIGLCTMLFWPGVVPVVVLIVGLRNAWGLHGH